MGSGAVLADVCSDRKQGLYERTVDSSFKVVSFTSRIREGSSGPWGLLILVDLLSASIVS